MSDKDAKMNEPQAELEASYNRVAALYAAEFFDELARKSFDRERLDEFAASVRCGRCLAKSS
ncbi:MAG TPA: hypothetical protein VE821_03105 [Pyrinomonadaceae bacterium]|nr:hypothetical protein [Pyrinomonadaceae bacterium]